MIGVFDSGVGGLTVLQALRRRLPRHDFLYVGDTARAPYGNKPAPVIKTFACDIAGFLRESGVEGIVVACNTASAIALPELRQRSNLPVWGMIDAGVEAATRVTRTGNVGVIATHATIESGAYQHALQALGMNVWARECPLLVHVVEEGLAESPEADFLVRHYLSGRPDIDTLILGCTHYPLLRAAIQRVVGPHVRLVDSAEVTAERLAVAVPDHGSGEVTYFATGGKIGQTVAFRRLSTYLHLTAPQARAA